MLRLTDLEKTLFADLKDGERKAWSDFSASAANSKRSLMNLRRSC